ncbi:DUF2877 domain-containing protein [Aeromonas diversa]|uniref:DUF2877 domain-containing protein n=1 Tax=Aeromonas diversa TaxID=502790 RepID=UPI0003A6086E|nr:DUF2877 domain-containing protein [Aeromonas diversa]
MLTVHSRFRHACNLRSSEGEWLTLLVHGMPLPPAGLILSCEELPAALQPGSRWCWDSSLHSSSGDEIGVSDCQWSITRLVRGLDNEVTLLGELNRLLPLAPPAGGFWAQKHEYDGSYLVAPLTELGHWLKGAWVDLSSTLKRLLGYGQGLTPSGDDFLLGVLFALEGIRNLRRGELVVALLPLLGRTTDISAAMLLFATMGHYGEHLLQLGAGESEILNRAVTQVFEYGHSSGHDILCGVHFVLSQSHEKNIWL